MKSVSFYPTVHVVEVMSIDDYTPSEIKASWFDEEEMEMITDRCFKVIRSMDDGRGRKYCFRGLESHTKLGSLTKNRNRSDALTAVLTEQAQQWVDNKFNDQAIADVYQRTTSSCQMWARVMANKDRQAADAILSQDEEEWMEEMRIAAPTVALHERNTRERTTLEKSIDWSFLNNTDCKISSPQISIRATQVVDAVRRMSPSMRNPRTARLAAVH